MTETLGVMLATAMGYAVAGMVASAHILVTSQRVKFEYISGQRRSSWPQLATLALLLVSGPVVLLRNAIRAAAGGLRPRYWLFFSTIVASGWSFCLGLVIFNLLVLLNIG